MMRTDQKNKDDLSLYGDMVLLRFTPSGHRYKISLDGGTTWEAKVGVTTVLAATVAKDGLIPWAAGLAAETYADMVQSHFAGGGSWEGFDTIVALGIARQAHMLRKTAGADIGTIVHSYIEDHISKGYDSYMPTEPEAKRAIVGFLTWENTVRPKWLSIEQPVYSKAYDYCGTYDAIAKINGKTVMLDFKTGNARYDKGKPAVYPEHFIQIGGYSLANDEESGEQPDRHAVLYIQKDGQVHYFDSRKVSENEDAFIHALELYHHLQELKQ